MITVALAYHQRLLRNCFLTTLPKLRQQAWTHQGTRGVSLSHGTLSSIFRASSLSSKGESQRGKVVPHTPQEHFPHLYSYPYSHHVSINVKNVP